MSIREIISQVETQICQLERARAVLAEASDYFDDNKSIEWLPYYAEQISLLLHVVDGLVFDAVPELEEVVKNLAEVKQNG